MSGEDPTQHGLTRGPRVSPAQPLWSLVPTRGEDGRSLADFMMLIPGLADRPLPCRERVATMIREVCESYGDRIAFADINYAINVLWVSVVAEPGLGGQVAQSIRQRVPDALLVGGQLGGSTALQVTASRNAGWRRCLRRLSHGASRLLSGPSR